VQGGIVPSSSASEKIAVTIAPSASEDVRVPFAPRGPLSAEGMRRLGFGDDVMDYFDEHVEADAVHEQIAGFDMAGSLAEDRPDLLRDIMFGAAACLAVDGWGGAHIHEAWTQGRSSLRDGSRS
jgi:hypothetical protein